MSSVALLDGARWPIICNHHGVLRSKLGVSRSLIEGSFEWPIYAVRHPPENGSTGWYLWTGEYSQDDDFFLPWHTRHLVARIPELRAHLSLRPGTGFIFAPDYFDVWFDPELLEI